MKKSVTALALMAALLPALAGCGRVRYPAYYTLNLPSPPDPPAPENVRTSIAVREFQSPGYLRQGPIVYRTTPEEVGFYEYHRWAADPRMLVTSAVIDHLRAVGQFSTITKRGSRSRLQSLHKSPRLRPVQRSGAMLFPKLDRCPNETYPGSCRR
jgi:ABC-type uncharacterized transport system auxiliary subunit